MKNFILSILLVFSLNNIEAQILIDTTLIFNSKSAINNLSTLEVNRVFVDSNEFKDYGLICSNDTSELCALKFLHKKNTWKIWIDSKWQEIFNDKGEPNEIIFRSMGIVLLPKKTYEYGLDKEILFCFIEKNLNVDFSTDNGYQYLFSKKNGIVMMGMHVSTFFKRSDYSDGDIKLIEIID